MAHEAESPWLAAWARLRAGESPIDYIRIQPTPGDVILLNAWQSERRHVFLWRALVDRYQVADVLIPELILERSHVGGPISGLLIVRFGPSGGELARVTLANPTGDAANLMDTAVKEADRIYVTALRAGRLLPDPSLLEPETPAAQPADSGTALSSGFAGEAAGGLKLRVATPDDATLTAIERTLRGTPGVSGVRVSSYSIGGDSLLEANVKVSLDTLRQSLDARGLRLQQDGATLILRRRTAEDAPLTPPEAPVLEEELEEVAPAGETAPTPGSGG